VGVRVEYGTGLEELRYYFILRRDLGFKLEYNPVATLPDHVGRMLNGLIKSMRI